MSHAGDDSSMRPPEPIPRLLEEPVDALEPTLEFGLDKGLNPRRQTGSRS